MQLTYVFSELGNGLKRNVSMTIAVIVTIFVSLTLVGMGLLLNAQAAKAEEYWGSKLQITVFLCNENSTTANCVNGEVTDAQKAEIENVLDTNNEVVLLAAAEQAGGLRQVAGGVHLRRRHRAACLRVDPALGHAGVLLGPAEGPREVPRHQVARSRACPASTPSVTCARCSSRSTSG